MLVVVLLNPLLLTPSNPAEHQANVCIAGEVQAAQDKLPRPPATISLSQTEQLGSDLQAIDPTGVPAAVQDALSHYTAAVERHARELRATGMWNTNTAHAIGEAQRAFREALMKERWVP